MTGVEILAANEVAITGWHWGAFLITTGVILFCFIVLELATSDRSDRLGLFLSLIFCIFVSCVFGTIAGASFPTGYETQYKVTISDEVSMNEFLERYEIIEQEGKIYTVRERND